MSEDKILAALARSPGAVADRECLHELKVSPEALAEIVRQKLPGLPGNGDVDAFWQTFVDTIGPDYHFELWQLTRLINFKIGG